MLIKYVLLHQEILTHSGTQFILVFIIMLILFRFLFKLFILAFAKWCIIAGVVPHKHFIDTTANDKKKSDESQSVPLISGGIWNWISTLELEHTWEVTEEMSLKETRRW